MQRCALAALERGEAQLLLDRLKGAQALPNPKRIANTCPLAR
jgi:hypothetical protein